MPTGIQIKKPHPKIPSFSRLIFFFFLRKKIHAAQLDITTPRNNNTDYDWDYSSEAERQPSNTEDRGSNRGTQVTFFILNS
jgi:hypothetical protein